METDSAQETLERLERYVSSLPTLPPRRARPSLPSPPPPARPFLLPLLVRQPVVPAPASVPAPMVDSQVSPPAVRAGKLTRRLAEATAMAVAASSCVVAVVFFERLDGAAAAIAAAALGAVALIGLVGRVPFARAWVVGLVVAALLVRFS